MKLLVFLFGGMIFGYGLAVSGMAQPEIVLSFLQIKDLGLLLVLGSAVVVAILAFQILPKIMKNSVMGGKFEDKREKTSKNTIYGAVIFGLGWGLSGMCPGSAIASLGIGNAPIVIGIVGMFLGTYVYGITQL